MCGLVDDGEYKKALIVIEEFLNKYPPFYFDEYMLKYVYFDECEMKTYRKYFCPNKKLINLHPSQNYCEIFNLKARILLNLDKCDDADDSAFECLKLNPLNVGAKIILADIKMIWRHQKDT